MVFQFVFSDKLSANWFFESLKRNHMVYNAVTCKKTVNLINFNKEEQITRDFQNYYGKRRI